MDDILNKQGNEFDKKGLLINALTEQGLLDVYEAYETNNGGFIGVPIGDERIKERLKNPIEKPKTEKKSQRVRVYRANCDEANRDNIIRVTANGPRGRKVFMPGEDVTLTETQLNILKDSVMENRIEIDPASGIYSARNPEVAAKNQYPNMQIKRDSMTGRIVVWRSIPNYIIERIDA